MKMQSVRYSVIIALIIISIANAQDSPQWQLPDYAKMRLGKGQFNDLAYSRVGERLAVATSIGIWIYDAQTGEERNLLTGGNGKFNRVAFSPDGTMLISDINYRELCLWDVNTGRQIRRLWGHSQPSIEAVAFSPDGKKVVSGGFGSTVRIWDVATGRQLHTLRWHIQGVTSVAFSPDSKMVVSGSADKSIIVWDAESGAAVHRFSKHANGISSVAFHPNGKIIASGSYDKTVRLWDVETGEQHLWTLSRFDDAVIAVAFSSDGNTLAIGSKDSTIRLWRLADRLYLSMLRLYRGEKEPTHAIAFSPDNRTIVSGSQVGTVRFWDVFRRWNTHTITGHYRRGLESVAFSPDNNTVASGGSDAVIRVWHADTGTLQREIIGHKDRINSVAFSPDGNTIASGSNDGTARLWDADTGAALHKLINIVGHVNTVAFTSDGKILVCEMTMGDWTARNYERSSRIYLFDVETGAAHRTIKAFNAPLPTLSYNPEFNPTEHTFPINRIAVSPNGKVIASSGDDDTIRLWDVETGEHLRVLSNQAEYVNSIAFSPDGTILASVGAGDDNGEFVTQIHLRDITNGMVLRTINTSRDDNYSIRFSPDGSILASGSSNNTLRLWNVHHGTLIRTLASYPYDGFHAQSINSVAFSPDGTTLASAGSNGTIVLWNTQLPPLTNTTVGLSPVRVVSPVVGKHVSLSLNIGAGQNVSGYQATVHYDVTALRYVESRRGDYLHESAYVIPPVVEDDSEHIDCVKGTPCPDGTASVTLGAISLTNEVNNDGTLATIIFEVIAVKPSTVILSDVLLTDSVGNSTKPIINAFTEITEPDFVREDVNEDGFVNILDIVFIAANIGKTGRNAADVNADGIVNIVDLALVAAAMEKGDDAAAPALWSQNMPSRAVVTAWIQELKTFVDGDIRASSDILRGISFLEKLLVTLTPTQTALLPNYPNPFNPETWIPFQLSRPGEVRIEIYTSEGKFVRALTLGHKSVGIYQDRARAAYWDGRNSVGEQVAAGVYFLRFEAGDYSAVRKLTIVK